MAVADIVPVPGVPLSAAGDDQGVRPEAVRGPRRTETRLTPTSRHRPAEPLATPGSLMCQRSWPD